MTTPPRQKLTGVDIVIAVLMAFTIVSNAHWIIQSGEWLTFLRTIAITGASVLLVSILRQ